MRSLFRLARVPFADDLTGEGARRIGGRWSSRGVPVIHASESAALASVEVLVHVVDAQDIPRDLRLVELELDPQAGDIEELDTGRLPKNWRDVPPPASLKRFGDDWAARASSIGLRVPSVVMPHGHECNILLNPIFTDFEKFVRIVRIDPFAFDPRIPLAPPKDS